MAVGPIGNTIFVNQMTPAAASNQNAHQNRIDFQNMAAQVAANEEKKEVEQVRPAEENHEVDPDREHQRQEADEQNKRNPKNSDKEKNSTDEQGSPQQPSHILDIKV